MFFLSNRCLIEKLRETIFSLMYQIKEKSLKILYITWTVRIGIWSFIAWMPIILPKKKRTTHILLLLSMGCVYFAHICSFPTFLPSHIRRCMFFPRNLHEAPCCILNIILKALAVHPFLLRIASRFTTFHSNKYLFIFFNRTSNFYRSTFH